MSQQRIPVTVLTGFLGSGKTTLLNHLLTASHGYRIAVIENEYGEIGIDHALVIDSDEEVFEMSNGCICCTVRGDLIRVLNTLMKRRDKFDYILLETTGLANPAPVAQTFFVDQEIQSHFWIDGIVTVVDSKHISLHLDKSSECREQIAFADVMILNKTDLVSREEVSTLEQRLKHLNPLAQIHRATHSRIDPSFLMNIKAFDLSAKTSLHPEFLKEELPFERLEVYRLATGRYRLKCPTAAEVYLDSMNALDFKVSPEHALPLLSLHAVHHDHDHSHTTSEAHAEGILKEIRTDRLDDFKRKALMAFADHRITAPVSEKGSTPFTNSIVGFHSEVTEYPLTLSEPMLLGMAIDTCHASLTLESQDSALRVYPIGTLDFEHSHEHDSDISSVGIEETTPLIGDRVNQWLTELLRDKGQDIFRMKGILYLEGEEQRYVFQGVHMMFDGQADRLWEEDEIPKSQLVFIGKHLNRTELINGFRSCLITAH